MTEASTGNLAGDASLAASDLQRVRRITQGGAWWRGLPLVPILVWIALVPLATVLSDDAGPLVPVQVLTFMPVVATAMWLDRQLRRRAGRVSANDPGRPRMLVIIALIVPGGLLVTIALRWLLGSKVPDPAAELQTYDYVWLAAVVPLIALTAWLERRSWRRFGVVAGTERDQRAGVLYVCVLIPLVFAAAFVGLPGPVLGLAMAGLLVAGWVWWGRRGLLLLAAAAACAMLPWLPAPLGPPAAEAIELICVGALIAQAVLNHLEFLRLTHPVSESDVESD